MSGLHIFKNDAVLCAFWNLTRTKLKQLLPPLEQAKMHHLFDQLFLMLK